MIFHSFASEYINQMKGKSFLEEINKLKGDVKMNIFSKIRQCFAPTFEESIQDMYKDIDKVNKKRGESLHYECINRHKWINYFSPTGSYCGTNYGIEQTRRPKKRKRNQYGSNTYGL